ncbi:hypothetical protein [Nocardia brasiliensis]|uniref:hypothetical protein n=1 Tax=Nocardia brasiliensis TaxID=37326 RepID=UPI001893FE03|nr:hypothetical protein [Nocardia brasiliensis]MBF6547025.1 hypothetical protein [Nocardia brasiliensis]
MIYSTAGNRGVVVCVQLADGDPIATEGMSLAPNPAPASVLIGIELDQWRLPVSVEVDRSLHQRRDPSQFSAEAMNGYWVAFWRREAATIASGQWERLSLRPSRRAQWAALLGASTLAEFVAIETAGDSVYEAAGPVTDFDKPSVTVRAELSGLTEIFIDPRWAATALPFEIGHDILACADQIRAQRPVFDEPGRWADQSDAELESKVAQQRLQLEGLSR